MNWQDLVFLVGGFIFAVNLMPIIRNSAVRLPRSTSVPTATVLFVFAFTQFTLGLMLGGLASVLTAAAWSFIAARRAA